MSISDTEYTSEGSNDISEVMIDKAKERARRQGLMDKVEFRVADAFQLPSIHGLCLDRWAETQIGPAPPGVRRAGALSLAAGRVVGNSPRE